MVTAATRSTSRIARTSLPLAQRSWEDERTRGKLMVKLAAVIAASRLGPREITVLSGDSINLGIMADIPFEDMGNPNIHADPSYPFQHRG